MNRSLQKHLQAGEQAGRRYALAIPRDAMQGTTGCRLSSHAGSSLDFKDFREYEPGDDLRRIDWGAYARSDKLIVKLYREEVSPHLDLLLDTSRSINMPDSRKAEGFLKLAGLFSSAAANAGCSHKAWSAGNMVIPLPNGNRPASEWQPPEFNGTISPSEAIHLPPPPRWRRRGIRILLSDLLWEDDPMLFLRPFADGAAAVHIIQILTRNEIDPDLQGNSRLVDIESDQQQEVFIDTLTRSRYCEALARHQQQWHSACRRTGATFSIITAENLLTQNPRLPILEQSQILQAI
jgi:uncharacterized protein (DUF58 family)